MRAIMLTPEDDHFKAIEENDLTVSQVRALVMLACDDPEPISGGRIAERIGGLPTLTAVVVILTGITGAMTATTVLGLLRINDQRADGLAGEGFAPYAFVREVYDNTPPAGAPGVLCTFLAGERARAAERLCAL